ncbi:hypothetical protein H257_05654 [Aphanomyces astaci]|uniref:Uncharacterized protein n=1 Tax=Aphanomyces astaci TaxID=112090 RepID=W4GMX5_APHAT|nr:hypothetical protein H257_05654 [Aphanomyces astaci]ETV81032.1 hypothetical protein H257_05654 [Aphanomyces astaci]|eukprot:XP_009828890.1 hypothetical protein H257_05654 [Aphanomyces astaci]
MAARTKAKTPMKKELTERLARLEAANTVGNFGSLSTEDEVAQNKKLMWRVDMVQILLELRLRTFSAAFGGSKSNKQFSML